MKTVHSDLYKGLNNGQRHVYDSILDSVNNQSGTPFFVYGHGGTDIIEESTCDIKKGTQLAKLLAQTTLIIWDEAPMANRYCFEAFDRTLKDILSEKDQSNTDSIFGGLTVALGSDFRQILPVIPKGKKHDIIQACLSSSSLWKHVTVLTLTENMRLKTNLVNPIELDNFKAFDKRLLNIGEGRDITEDESYIQIPKDLKIDQHASHKETIMNVVFPDLFAQINNIDYMREREREQY
ncbi:uncharacterized protein LOC116126951 [Pistacia vera]|uniref:uncharacterized protein LOC116126951 n=1 Tax=Pistacia vera TaxID=55513 RepID=UPI001263A1C3|nr:uncharacterized protein LOC116126951 [Pistacia vera]